MTAPLGEGVTAEALIQSLQDNGFKMIEGKTLEQIMPGVNHDARHAGVAVLRDTSFKGSGKGSSELSLPSDRKGFCGMNRTICAAQTPSWPGVRMSKSVSISCCRWRKPINSNSVSHRRWQHPFIPFKWTTIDLRMFIYVVIGLGCAILVGFLFFVDKLIDSLADWFFTMTGWSSGRGPLVVATRLRSPLTVS